MLIFIIFDQVEKRVRVNRTLRVVPQEEPQTKIRKRQSVQKDGLLRKQRSNQESKQGTHQHQKT